MLASSPLVSGYFVMLACCLGCVLSLFVPVPCVILASDVFLSGWLLGPLSGLTPGGGSLRGCLPWLGPAPLFVCEAGSLPLVYLCTLRVLGSVSGVRCFTWFFALILACSLFTDWVFCPFSFLRPLLFRSSLSRFLGFAVPLVVPVGVFLSPVAFLPWPAFLSLGPGVS